MIEVDALAKGNEVPKFRTFSLWRAGYILDGYGSTIDRWLEGTIRDGDLDYVPSARIRQYLTNIRLSGTVPELHSYRTEQHDRVVALYKLHPSDHLLMLRSYNQTRIAALN
jgi:hypothetical protein